MNKPYHEMTPAERLANRIAKNREIDQRVLDRKPTENTPSGRKQRSTDVAVRARANNTLDKFQEIKRTQGIDAASDYVHERIKSINE
jgi:hypothetical protein